MKNKKYFLFPANGIHYSAYQLIFNRSSQPTSIVYPPLKSKPPCIPKNLSWDYFHDDLQPDIKGKHLHGLGHSLGGALLLYDALKHPGRWETIVIVEPALFSKKIHFFTNIIRFFKLEHQLHPMIRITKHRRTTFRDKPKVFDRWRQHSSFAGMSDESLQHFIDASLVEDGDGFKLRFPKEWEIAIYASMCTLDPFIWSHLHTLTSKLIVVAGQTSNTFMSGARARLKQKAAEFLTVPNTTHLLPFETPDVLRAIIEREINL